MNREILSRAKCKSNGVWVTGYVYQHEPPLPGVVPNGYVPETSRWFILRTAFADWNMPRQVEYLEIAPATIGRYIGIADKSGTKIFEGDIVKDDWGKTYEIFYTINSCSFMAKCLRPPHEWETGNYRIGKAWCDTISVIGNIHDNSELLEG